MEAAIAGSCVVPPAAAGPVVVGNVAGGLLEVSGEPPSLDDLGQDVRALLDRDVGAAELRDGIVAVLDEDPLVELLCLGGADVVGDGPGLTVVELVEEQPAQRFLRARVAGEQRAFDDLGQVDDREDRPVDVGEVALENGPFLGRELLDDVRVGHGASLSHGGGTPPCRQTSSRFSSP